MNPTIFAANVIAPVLRQLDLFSLAAQQLLLGTAIQESRLINRRQIRGGPALGLYQMEPDTIRDIWDNYLKYRQPLAKKIEALLSGPTADKVKDIQNNDKYATAMARALYSRISAPMPAAGDIPAMARYWKQYYNTPLGAGAPSEFIAHWNEAIGTASPTGGKS